jgi:hypothetical protein
VKGVARLNEMAEDVVKELAWQMGRPVRYGGEFKRRQGAHAVLWSRSLERAHDAPVPAAPIEKSDGFEPLREEGSASASSW